MIKNTPKQDLGWLKKSDLETSLMVQWPRFHTPSGGAQVPSLVRELELTCCNWTILHATTETWCCQINEISKNKLKR